MYVYVCFYPVLVNNMYTVIYCTSNIGRKKEYSVHDEDKAMLSTNTMLQ